MSSNRDRLQRKKKKLGTWELSGGRAKGSKIVRLSSGKLDSEESDEITRQFTGEKWAIFNSDKLFAGLENGKPFHLSSFNKRIRPIEGSAGSSFKSGTKAVSSVQW